MRPFGYKADFSKLFCSFFPPSSCLVNIKLRQRFSSPFLNTLRKVNMKTPSNTRWPSRDLEWIVRESWWSAKSGSIMSKSQILCVLARPLICRQRWISSDERQKRPRIVKCWGGRSAPGNGGRLTPLGHRSQRCQPQVEKRGGRFVRIAQNEVSSFPCFLSSCLVGLTLFLRASLR